MQDIKRALDWIIPLLKKKGISFQITGGFAAYLYGATRQVNDIDIDLPTSNLDSLLPEVESYITSPPQRHSDTTWDLYVCTLNYHGQLIDLTGASDAFIHNKDTGRWDALEMNFGLVVWRDALGHSLPVQNPNDLIAYKLKIKYDEEKHLEDVVAVRQFLIGNSG
jgi:hypothetical protein